MRRTQAKHAKATPRGRVPRPTRRGRGGLLLGALAVLVAAIVAIPALSALAAPTPVEYVKVTLPGSSYPPHDGAALYDDDVKVGVEISLLQPAQLDTSQTTVTRSDGGAANVTRDWYKSGGSTSGADGDNWDHYNCEVTLSGEASKVPC